MKLNKVKIGIIAATLLVPVGVFAHQGTKPVNIEPEYKESTPVKEVEIVEEHIQEVQPEQAPVQKTPEPIVQAPQPEPVQETPTIRTAVLRVYGNFSPDIQEEIIACVERINMLKPEMFSDTSALNHSVSVLLGRYPSPKQLCQFADSIQTAV